jgi:hypothetical protein
MYAENADEEMILDTIRLARRRRKTETLIIRIVDGVIIVMRGQVIINSHHHPHTHDLGMVDRRNGNR